MADSVKITVLGDELFVRRLMAIRYRARDMKPVLRPIARRWSRIIDLQFETQGARGGRPWAPLRESTVKRRGSSRPILVHHGDLLDSIGEDNIEVTDDSITLHFDEDQRVKAESHQYGFFNHQAGREVPARPIFVLTALDKEQMRGAIGRYLFQGDRT